MSKHAKLLARLLNRQSAFTWPELVTLLTGFGYRLIEGEGSRVKFDMGDPHSMVVLHKPHPGNELKPYVKRHVIDSLKAGGLI